MVNVISLLDSVGVPYSQLNFKEYKDAGLPDPPFILWNASPEQFSGSDDRIFIKRQTVTIELYEKKLDSEYETAIEAVLNKSDADYTKTKDYDSNEKVYVITYTFINVCKVRR